MLFNLAVYGLIVILSSLFAPHPLRVHIVGWICAVFSVCVFAAPLTIIRLVIKTKSVEFMPFSLSLLLTLCAVFWLIYGLALDDYYIAAPNILGFAFGLTQMGLYLIYRNKDKSKNVVISVTITKLEAEEEEEEEAAAKAKGKQYLGDQTLVDEPKKEERPTDLNV
ncbi:Bidirectional sugar transporter NEC1 [Linum grandiflorum]